MAFVIMSHGAAATLLQRQSRLCAVKSLDRGLLVDTQHERFVWRIQIQSDNVMEFLHKLLIAAQLERPGQVGFQMVLLPDAPDSGFAHALSLGHQAGAKSVLRFPACSAAWLPPLVEPFCQRFWGYGRAEERLSQAPPNAIPENAASRVALWGEKLESAGAMSWL